MNANWRFDSTSIPRLDQLSESERDALVNLRLSRGKRLELTIHSVVIAAAFAYLAYELAGVLAFGVWAIPCAFLVGAATTWLVVKAHVTVLRRSFRLQIRRFRLPYCVSCSHSLTGCNSLVCPECGTEIAQEPALVPRSNPRECSISEVGIVVKTESGSMATLPWRSIEAIAVYPVHSRITGVCAELALIPSESGSPPVAVCEEDVGWTSLLSEVRSRFPGIRDNWPPKLTVPPIGPGWVLLWERETGQ